MVRRIIITPIESPGSVSKSALTFLDKYLFTQKIQIKTLKGDLFQIEVDGEDQVLQVISQTCISRRVDDS